MSSQKSPNKYRVIDKEMRRYRRTNWITTDYNDISGSSTSYYVGDMKKKRFHDALRRLRKRGHLLDRVRHDRVNKDLLLANDKKIANRMHRRNIRQAIHCGDYDYQTGYLLTGWHVW